MVVTSPQVRAPAGARTGGTLRLLGPGDVDHLDPATAHRAPVRQVLHLISRQLLTYAPHPDLRDWQATDPVPDVAVAVPSTYNAGLGASHRSYVLHLRPDVLWDTMPPRPVTAHDFVRGFKRVGNPVARSSALAYFRSTIRGMAGFCDDFAAAVPAATATAAQLAAYQQATEIPGVFALDDETLVVELVRASPDFPHMLALPCAAAAPAEYDAFVPGSRELLHNLRSNGPYRVAHHVPGAALRLEPNPAWRPGSDPVRRRHLDAVEITVAHVDPAEIAARIDTGDADLAWGAPVPASPQGPVATGNTLAHALDPSLVFNLASGHPALRDVRVRRAVATAVDREAVAAVYRDHGAGVDVRVARSVVPPGNDVHREGAGEGTTNGRDPARAGALLAEAGYRSGLTLAAVHQQGDLAARAARSCAADLEEVGIDVRLVGLDAAAYEGLVDDPAVAAAGEWDLLVRSWRPDWRHGDARVFLQPLFESGASGNLGGYRDAAVDDLIRSALEAVTEPPARALAAWQEVERRVLDEAVIVPLLFQAPAVPQRRSARVRHAVPVPALGYVDDLASLWLDATEPT